MSVGSDDAEEVVNSITSDSMEQIDVMSSDGSDICIVRQTIFLQNFQILRFERNDESEILFWTMRQTVMVPTMTKKL